jgi:hypothetical protein
MTINADSPPIEQKMQMHDILQPNPEIWHLFTNVEDYGEVFRDGYDRFPHLHEQPPGAL